VRLNASYLQARLAEMAEVIARLAPRIEAHGTLRERGLFNRGVLLLRMREQRYRPDPETVELAALAAAQLREAGDAYEACFAAFTHAFCMLWSGATDAATRELTEVLADTVRLGDAERRLLCLTYLAVAGRLRGDVDSAQAFAEAAAAAARSAGSAHYEGMANANLAWVAWRRGDAATADELMDAVAERTSTQVRYPFVWLHALVGLARAVDANDVAAALAYARPMTDGGQQLLPPPVEAALDAAVDEPTLARLAAVVDASRQVGYL
jgi:ATP/maltotriose-dependent transcriptional regulator MalT